MLGTILSIGKIAEALSSAHSLYDAVSGIVRGDNKIDRAVDKISDHLVKLNQTVEKLSDSILYAPNLETVTTGTREKIDNLREVRQVLEPMQKAMGDKILSSSMMRIPERMNKAFKKNPWEVLENITPIAHSQPPQVGSSWIPISFEHEATWYIGWQKLGVIPSLFDCEINELQLDEDFNTNNSWKSDSASTTDYTPENQPSIAQPQAAEPRKVDEVITQTEMAENDDNKKPKQKRLVYLALAGIIASSVVAGSLYLIDSEDENAANSKVILSLNQAIKIYSNKSSKHYGQMIHSLQLHANKGDAKAQYFLAESYYRGTGVKQNTPKAIQWFRISSKLGNKDAKLAISRVKKKTKVRENKIKVEKEKNLDIAEIISDEKERAKKVEQYQIARLNHQKELDARRDKIRKEMQNAIVKPVDDHAALAAGRNETTRTKNSLNSNFAIQNSASASKQYALIVFSDEGYSEENFTLNPDDLAKGSFKLLLKEIKQKYPNSSLQVKRIAGIARKYFYESSSKHSKALCKSKNISSIIGFNINQNTLGHRYTDRDVDLYYFNCKSNRKIQTSHTISIKLKENFPYKGDIIKSLENFFSKVSEKTKVSL